MRPAAAVVVGGGIGSLAAMRELGRSGVDVALVTDDPHDPALRSRWCRSGHVLPGIAEDGDVVADLLEERAAQWAGRVVLPGADEGLEGLARHADRLRRWFRVPIPPLEAVLPILRKDLTQDAAEALGIDVARCYGEADHSALDREDIVYPVVVKPIESRPFFRRFHLKLFVARDAAELARAVTEFAAAGLRGLIFDLIPGADRHLYHYTVYIDARGEPTAEQAMRKLRASPPFYGVSRVVEPVHAPELREPTLAFLRHIGWRGVAEASFKLDPRDGRFRLLEVNGRFFTQQGLSLRCGLPYARLAWREAVDGERPRARDNGWPGVWIDLHDDLYYGLFHRRAEGLGIGEYLAPYLRPKIFSVWSLSDPLPFFARWRHSGRLLMGASVNGASRKVRDSVQPMPV